MKLKPIATPRLLGFLTYLLGFGDNRTSAFVAMDFKFQGNKAKRFNRVLGLPATQVQIPPALWRRIEIRFVFWDKPKKLARIQPV
jgi:hypothetical protein